jgi:ABC-type branched-subunit amino acid transport system substrate-binding protein
LCLAVTAACGSEGSGGDGGGDAGGTIKLMQIAPYESQLTSLPFMKTAAQAAVDEINDAGGVGGRKLELLTCNEKSDANEALRCAQKAVQEKVTAVVGSLTTFGAQVMPILEKGKIASVGADAITPYDAESSSSFLFDAGVPGYAAMPAIAVKSLGATKLVGVHAEGPAAPTNQDFFKMGADLAGATFADNIVIPLDSIDYTQYIARAEDKGAQAIVSSLPPEGNLKLWKAIGSSGSDLKVVASAGSVTPAIVTEAGKAAEGSYVVAGTPAADDSNEWGKAYVTAVKKYEPDEKVFAGVGLRAYQSLSLFKTVAETIEGDIDNESVLDAFKKVNGLKFAWVESLSFDKDGPIKDLPRVVSSVTFPAKVVGGKFVPEDSFDPFA